MSVYLNSICIGCACIPTGIDVKNRKMNEHVKEPVIQIEITITVEQIEIQANTLETVLIYRTPCSLGLFPTDIYRTAVSGDV